MKASLAPNLIDALRLNYDLLRPTPDTPEGAVDRNTFIIADGKRRYTAKLYDDVSIADKIALFQDFLRSAHIPVPAVLTNRSGGLVTALDGRGLIVSEYVDGLPIGWGKDFASISKPISFAVAGIVAKMHKVCLDTNIKAPLDHRMSVDRIISTDSDLSKKLSAVDISRVRRTIIHGDLTRENILLNQSRDSVIAVIDFGDAHYDYVAYDIATLLTQVYVTKSWGIDFQGITGFLARYNEINELNADELRTLLPLMVARNKVLKEDIDKQISGNPSGLKRLESIKRSIESKLESLEKHHQRLENLILKV